MCNCDNALLQEVAERLRRTETRLVNLGESLGHDLRTKTPIYINKFTVPSVTIDRYDVSVSRIITALAEQGIRSGEVPVRIAGNARILFSLNLDNCKHD